MKKNIVIIILSVFVLGLGTFICVDKFILNEKMLPETECIDKSNEEKEETEEILKEDEIVEEEIKKEESYNDIAYNFANEYVFQLEENLTKEAGATDGIELEEYYIANMFLYYASESRIVVGVSYDVKPKVVNDNTYGWWCIGDGEVQGNWVVGKSQFLELTNDGTGFKIARTSTSNFDDNVYNWRK